jgi:cytochrome c oxidase subunit II
MHIFPENVSTYGHEIDNLFWLVLGFAGVAFVISLFVLFYPLFKNHHSKVSRAQYITGESRKHFRWITIALVLLAMSDFIILFAEHGTWEKIENVPSQQDVHVAIIGRQWNWIFTYPGPDGKLYTADDVTIDEQNSELHVPVNKNIVIDLKARDVLHSFFVVNSRLKQDCIPGRTNSRWFNITKEGRYDISCAEICGMLHSQMRNFLVVESQEKYDQFLKTLYEKNSVKL